MSTKVEWLMRISFSMLSALWIGLAGGCFFCGHNIQAGCFVMHTITDTIKWFFFGDWS